MWNSHAASLTVALAVGLLIGLDREKKKDAASLPEAPGVRTFALVALLGAMAAALGVLIALLLSWSPTAARSRREYARATPEC